jgi:hypothetical protein
VAPFVVKGDASLRRTREHSLAGRRMPVKNARVTAAKRTDRRKEPLRRSTDDAAHEDSTPLGFACATLGTALVTGFASYDA